MKIDMSPQAVTARLKKTSELRRLCIALGGDRLKEKLRNADYRPDRGINEQECGTTGTEQG